MTWLEVKTAIEAAGVTDETIITTITVSEGKPVMVVTDPSNPQHKVIKDTY